MTTDEARRTAHALDSISDYANRLQHVELNLTVAVIEARNAGASWATIGEQLGVSKQAAAQKYGKLLLPTD